MRIGKIASSAKYRMGKPFQNFRIFGISILNWKNSEKFLIFQVIKFWKFVNFSGGGQNLERRNVERPIFQNFKIANIKITNDELIDSFIFEFMFSFFLNYLHTQNI